MQISCLNRQIKLCIVRSGCEARKNLSEDIMLRVGGLRSRDEAYTSIPYIVRLAHVPLARFYIILRFSFIPWFLKHLAGSWITSLLNASLTYIFMCI